MLWLLRAENCFFQAWRDPEVTLLVSGLEAVWEDLSAHDTLATVMA